MMTNDLNDDGFDALDFGLSYAFYRQGQDTQTEQLVQAMRSATATATAAPVSVQVHLSDEDEDLRGQGFINALDFNTVQLPDSWDDYTGQEPLKRQMSVYINESLRTGNRLPHTLFASGVPGVGKTTAARLTAQALNVDIIELVPPFNVYTLAQAAESLCDRDILFIDEIHKLSDNGKRGAEILLKILEDGVIFLPNGEIVKICDITIIGATTDRDKLPEPVIDRFKIKPYFQPYCLDELAEIAASFVNRHEAWDAVDADLCVDMALACRNTPRVLDEMVIAARALQYTFNRMPTAEELLEFIEVEPDGMTRVHVHYITALRQFFRRENADGEIEFISGEATMTQLLRETKQGIGRIERFLIERGMIDRTPRGRRLTAAGMERADEFIGAGKGASIG
jgi:Holliday junction DNA helicase RuvB